ncbi:MAG: glycine cleavage system aminomethyltransferase GcvT [Patescibacteria group bacterium]
MSKRTPIYDEHIGLGAKMVEFGGWDMPIYYPNGIISEHKAVREVAGLFDASHMGEFFIVGPNALDFVQKVSANDASRLAIGQIQYSFLLNDNGGVIDDFLVYHLGKDIFMFVVNAGNIEKDWQWLKAREMTGVKFYDVSDETALLALQGPKAREIMYSVLGESFAKGIALSPFEPVMSLALLPYYNFSYSEIDGKFILISRTGYTGEDGFEIFCHSEDAAIIWRILLEKGKDYGLIPCGLGARNTLRLEAGMPLWGHELSEDRIVFDANLGRFIGWNKKEDFIGKSALIYSKKSTCNQFFVGLTMDSRQEFSTPIARDGYEVYDSEGKDKIGSVTSGAPSPTLGKNIAMAYIGAHRNNHFKKVTVKIRDNYCLATIVSLPFYRREKK